MFIEKFEVPLVLLVKQTYEEDDTGANNAVLIHSSYKPGLLTVESL